MATNDDDKPKQYSSLNFAPGSADLTARQNVGPGDNAEYYAAQQEWIDSQSPSAPSAIAPGYAVASDIMLPGPQPTMPEGMETPPMWVTMDPDSPLYKRIMKDIEDGKRDVQGNLIPDMLTDGQREYLETSGRTYQTQDGTGVYQNNDESLKAATDDALGRRIADDMGWRYESHDSKVQWLSDNAPGAFGALVEAGLKPADVATVRNVYMAKEAANLVLQFQADFNPEGARQVMSAVPNEVKIIALAYMQEALDAENAVIATKPDFTMDPTERHSSPADDSSANPVLNITSMDDNTVTREDPYEEVKSLMDYGVDALSGAIHILLQPLEGVTHTARMFALTKGTMASGPLPWVDDRTMEDSLTPYGGELPKITNYMEYLGALKEATAPGFISAESMRGIGEKFGTENAQIMYGYYQATKSDDEDAVTDFLRSIQDNAEARALITSAQRGENVGGDKNEGAELYVAIAAADQGNWGNLVASGLGIDNTTLAYGAVRDTSNVASWFMFDPLLAAGKAGKIAKFARLGMESQVAKHGSVAHAIANSRPQMRAYDEFGRSVAAIKAETDPVKKAALQAKHKRQFTSRESRFFTDEHTEIALDYNLTDSVSWIEFYRAMDDVEKIVKGEAVTSMTGSVPKGIATRGPNAGKARGRGKTKGTVRKVEATETVTEAAPPLSPITRDAQRAEAAYIAAQGGTRQLYMPHMTLAKKALVRLGQQMSFSVTGARSGTVEMLERAMGPEWASKSVDEQVDAMTQMLAKEAAYEGEQKLNSSLGAILSDFKAMDEKGQRTVAGLLVDVVRGKPGASETVRKFGWRRKRSYNSKTGVDDSVARTVDTWRRLLTQLPDLRDGIVTRTARDADKVYQMAVASGVGTTAARVLRMYWIEAAEGQRQLMLPGLVRTFIRASGVHVTHPKAEKEIMELMSGVRAGERYAADAIPSYGALVKQISGGAATKRAAAVAEAMAKPNPFEQSLAQAQDNVDRAVAGAKGRYSKETLVKIRNDIKAEYNKFERGRLSGIPSEQAIAKADEAAARLPGGALDVTTRPDIMPQTGQAAGLWPGQMSPRMFVPNFQKIDEFAARQSMLNGLLFQGPAGGLVTDMWVLGTLYGPRFQLRNGLEDAGFWALTGGRWSSWRRGRAIDQAVIGSQARADVKYTALRKAKADAERDLLRLQARRDKGLITQEALDGAESRLTAATQAFADYSVVSGRAGKFGIVRSALTKLSEKATYRNGETVKDTLTARIAQFLVPTTSRAERLAAAQGGREAMAELSARAILRQKLRWSTNKDMRNLGRELGKGKKYSELTAKQQKLVEYETRLLKSQYAYLYKEEAAETTRHTMDGTLPVNPEQGSYTIVNGELYKNVYLDKGFVSSERVAGDLSETQAKALMAHLQFMTERYSINQEIMFDIERYWKAYNAVDGPNHAEMNKVVRDVIARSQGSHDWAYLMDTMRWNNMEQAEATVKRMMEDAANTMTTRGGEFNQKLWSALRHEDEGRKPYFAVWDEGTESSWVHMDDFVDGTFDHPERLLMFKGDAHPVRVNRRGEVAQATDRTWKNGVEEAKNWTSVLAWEPMGRSLARMTRNPIWYANYMEASTKLAPTQARWARIFGEKQAEKMATDLAAERAYILTMSYVDNPAIRSQLAWQVRNIARYYRAQEDFARRMLRLTKNEPMGLWKATLAFQAVGDFGFVHEDQYGDKYFIYPMSAPLMGAITGLGVDVKGADSPMAFGGKLQWLSPSLDPNSWAPSMSSPWAAVTLQPLLREMPVASSFFKEVEKHVFGEISAAQQVDTPFESGGDSLFSGLYSVTPPVFKKLLSLFGSAMGQDAPGTYGYKMTMKTLAGYAAAGRLPTAAEWADREKREEFLAKVQGDTIGVTFLSAIFGLFAPASPQYMENAESIAAREAGWEALHPAFRDMVQASVAEGDDWNTAWVKWLESNPDDYVFLPGITQSNETGYATPTMKNVHYIEDNLDVNQAAQRGIVPFLPEGRDDGISTNEAFQAMRILQPIQWKTVEDRATQMIGAEGYWWYVRTMAQYDQDLANTPRTTTGPNGETMTNPEYTAIEDQRTEARRLLENDYQGLDYRTKYERKEPSENKAVAEELLFAGRTLAERGNEKAKASLDFFDFYEYVTGEKASLISSGQSDQLTDLRATWRDGVQFFLADTDGTLRESDQLSIIYAFSGALDMESGL